MFLFSFYCALFLGDAPAVDESVTYPVVDKEIVACPALVADVIPGGFVTEPIKSSQISSVSVTVVTSAAKSTVGTMPEFSGVMESPGASTGAGLCRYFCQGASE